MSQANLDNWNKHLKGEFPGGLDALLAEDCVFYSPVVFTPQKGKALTKMYLEAAGGTFSEGDSSKTPGSQKSAFRYTKEICASNQIILEFESEMQGKYVNGVDIMTFNESGEITEFKVMIRPLQAVNMMHKQMQAMLESMASTESPTS